MAMLISFAPRKTVALLVGLLMIHVNLVTAADELVIEVLHKPDQCKNKTKDSDKLVMHYRGTLDDGKQFDSSYDSGTPFSFVLGAGQVIKGWDKGLLNMCVGEKRKLTIPHHMAYGEDGYPGLIPAKSTLHFDVELQEISESLDDELWFEG